MHVGNSFLHGRDTSPQVHAFQPRGHLLELLQVVAQDFSLAWQFSDRGHGTKCCSSPVGIDDQRITHGLKRSSARSWITNAQGVWAVVKDHWGGRGFAIYYR